MTASDKEHAGEGAGAPSVRRSVWLWMEFCVLFLVPPVVLWEMRQTFGFLVIPMLVGGLVVCGAWLVLDRSFDNRRFGFNGTGVGGLGPVLLAFVPLAAGVGLLTWLAMPEAFLGMPRERPGLWVKIMLLYPIFSVYPQEVIFRAFVFHRYRGIFRSEWAMILASGIAFGWAHLLFNHWLSVAMSMVGGVLFAWTYARTRSVMFAAIEHALWGDFIFTVGLGVFFYGGSVLAQS